MLKKFEGFVAALKGHAHKGPECGSGAHRMQRGANMKKLLKGMLTLLVLIVFTSLAWQVQAELINFDDQGLTGPSTFAAASPSPQHLDISTAIGTVQFDGGVILTNTTNLPANQTSVYGTASFGNNLANPLTITFPSNITNFFLDVYNGLTTDRNFRVSDNLGNSATFSLVPNLSSGRTQIGFPAAGNIILVQDIGTDESWDFFIDNIHFNEPLPPATPIPGTFLLLSSGLAILWSRRKKSLGIQ
jgi:hypothetical protein